MRRVAALLGLGLLAAVPAGAAANDGAIYPYETRTAWAARAPFTAVELGGPTWQIQAPGTTVAAGNVWELNWRCPVPGSEIADVLFTGLRTQAASSLAVQVTGDRVVLWAEPDAAMPQSPAGGRDYDVKLPGGNCNVHLALNQAETRVQHARGYFIAYPRVLLRDVAAPTVTLRALTPGWIGAGAPLRAEWTTEDNFGGDGVGAQTVAVDGAARWTGHPGVGNHLIDVDPNVPDGVHQVTISADGDGTPGAAVQGTIRVDRTPPGARALASSSPGTPGSVALSWESFDELSGVAASQAEINAAPDGGSDGDWTPAGDASPAPGRSLAAQPAVSDGVHAWRVRTADAAGNVTYTPGPAPLVVDRTAPGVELHGVPTGWIRALDLDLTATDALASTLGLGATEVDVNAAADGGEGGAWLQRSTTTGPAGRRVIGVPLHGLPSGRHLLRVRVHNGGQFAASLVTEVRADLRIDGDAPTIARAAFAAPVGRPLAVTWAADDVHAGVGAATLQWRQGTTWRTLATEAAADGAGSMAADGSSLPPGQQALRLVIADAAGNTVTRTGTVEIAATGVGAVAGDPLGRLRASRLTVGLTGARMRGAAGGRVVLVRTMDAGSAATVHGVLRDRAGHPIVGAEVEARGHRGRRLGASLTRAGGRFAFTIRPVAGGPLQVGVAAAHELLPRRRNADLRLEVRGRLDLGASSGTVGAGGTVLFTGRMLPSPAELGLGARKLIVLEWRDPVRRTWRPVVNARLRPDGTFAIPWAFNLRGLTIPVRVTVPQDVGWPLLTARSRVVKVRVV